MERAQAARYARRMALALTILGDSAGRSADWRAAARAMSGASEPNWRDWWGGTGPLAQVLPAEVEAGLRRLERTHSAPDLEALMTQIPPGLFDVLAITGLGARQVRTLWIEGSIVTLGQLERACLRGRLAKLPGFTPDLEARVLASIRRRRRGRGHWLRPTALARAQEREAVFARTKGLLAIERAGPLRRAWEIVDELVWVIAADNPGVVLGRLATLSGAGYPDPDAPDTLVFHHRDAPRERLIVTGKPHFAGRLFLETGSVGHVRGVLARITSSPGDADPGAAALPWLPTTEEEIYARAGLDFVPPELREGRGEIAAARDHALPCLVEAGDLQGVLHVHTDWSDGHSSIRDIAVAAREQGWSYVGIADHSRSAFYARGLDPQRLRAQAEAVRQVQAEFANLRIFHGLECDILPGGTLDLPPETLASLDYVIASIHTPAGEDRTAMTRRIVTALEQPATTLLAHPTGRLLLEREAYPLDWDELLDAAAQARVAIEFNARPERLDLDWRLLREATGRGIPICINPDAHSAGGLRVVADNIATARKGWLTCDQVLNTRGVEELARYFCTRRLNGAP
jgi:DNA polymerase (family X)